MLGLVSGARTFVVTQPVDGRKRADSLMAMVRDVLMHDPLSGHFYVFFTRRCDGVRIVYWDRDGIAMWSKRLERGRFHPKFSADGRVSASAMEWAELALVLEGIELAGARRLDHALQELTHLAQVGREPDRPWTDSKHRARREAR